MKVWKIALGVMLGIFAVMGVCVAVIANRADDAVKDIEATSETTLGTSGTSATTPRAAIPTTAAVTEVGLGSRLTITPGDHKVTVHAFKAPIRSTNQFNTPKAGQFVAVDVEYCAGPGGDRFGPNSFDFQLAMPDNTRLRPANSAGLQQPTLELTPLQAAECIRGWVNFDAPADPGPRFVIYTTGTASARWRLT